MFRIFEELNPNFFNRIFVEPMLKSYLNKLGNGDEESKVLKHISLCRIEIGYTREGTFISSEISDELSLIEHLSIAEDVYMLPNLLKKSKLKKFLKDKIVYETVDGTFLLKLYELKDVMLLKELGIYYNVLRFIKDVEKTYARFLKADYSQIKK